MTLFNNFAFSLSYASIIAIPEKDFKLFIKIFSLSLISYLAFSYYDYEKFLTLPLSFMCASILKRKTENYINSLLKSMSALIILFLFVLLAGNVFNIREPISKKTYDFIIGINLILFSFLLSYLVNKKNLTSYFKFRSEIIKIIIITECIITFCFSFLLPYALYIENEKLLAFSFYFLISFLLIVIIGIIGYTTYIYLKLEFYKNQQQYENISYGIINEKYNAIIKMRHYYDRLYKILGVHISVEDWKKVKKYYEEYIEPLHKKYIHNQESLKILELIKIPLIKDLLMETTLRAEHKHIQIYLDIKSTIELRIIKDIDLFIILNEWLLNAVQAIKDEGYIHIYFFQSKNITIIRISNTITYNVNINEIEKDGFTTKAGNHGKGLLNVNTVLKNYTNIFKSTYVEYNKFIQQLIIME